MRSDGILDSNRSPQAFGLAYGIWFISAALSVMAFLAGREMIIRTYIRFFPWEAWRFQLGQGSLSFINSVISLAMAILPIAVIIGGFEYQHRNMGTSQGWKMLARTLAVEIGILLLALYI